METELQRPKMKIANTRVTDADMIYFSLGAGEADYVLPSERNDYRSDARAIALVQAVKDGKDLSGQDFSGVNLKGADLSGGRFKGANFSNAIFYKTKARDCDFEGADFTGASLEKCDFTNSRMTDIVLRRTFARDNGYDGAELDEHSEKYFHSLERLILLIERGDIELNALSNSDLRCLDLRRMDLSTVDLWGIDLSLFALDGVNLCGTYLDPKQILSLQGWLLYLHDFRKMEEKRLKLEAIQVEKELQVKLAEYAQNESENHEDDIETPEEYLVRPGRKRFRREEFVEDMPPPKPVKKTSEEADETSENTSESKVINQPRQIRRRFMGRRRTRGKQK